MTTTYTATAMSSVARSMPSGVIGRGVYFNNANTTDITASANALRVQLMPIPNRSTILFLQEWHSCGAATCLADIGIKDQVLSLSAFMSQVTAGQANFAAKLPYIVSITDTQATQYAYVIGGFTPGTATSSIEMRMNVIYTLDQY